MREKLTWTRRAWLATAGTSMVGTAIAPASLGAEPGAQTAQQPGGKGLPLRLTDFQPKSMLHAKETSVPRARFPVIDIHTHVSFRQRAAKPVVPAAELIKTMDAVNLHTMVNLTGGSGEELAATIKNFDRAFPRRFVSMTEPTWTRASEAGYAAWQAEEIGKAKAAGAVGLKILKTLGLYLRDGGTTGKLVRVDDERFDPMWDACGRLGIPVAMHVGDPEAFFTPIDRFNERYEELGAHPDWSFYGKDFPAFKEILAAPLPVLVVVFGGMLSLPRDAGEVKVAGKPLPSSRPDVAIGQGVAYVAPDRKTGGGVMTMSARENLTLPDLKPFWKGGIVRRKAEKARTKEWFERLSVRPANATEEPLSIFSGGNQQKILFGKWLSQKPSVFLLDEPTQGVDVGAKSELHRELVNAAEEGAAVLISSSDLEELADLCDRVLVIVDGKISSVLEGTQLTQSAITRSFMPLAAEPVDAS